MRVKTVRLLVVGTLMLMTLLTSGCGDDKYVTAVKTGTLQMEPNIQIGKAFENFFANTKWKSFQSDKNQRIVEFTGDCTWHNSPAKCTIQFIVTSDTEFELGYVGINDAGMNRIESAAIVHKALTNKDFYE